MKYSFLSLLAALLLLCVACEQSSTIGNSLADEDLTIVVDSNFTLTGKTVANPVVQTRALSMLLGNIDAPGYGKLTSDYVAQLMPSLALDTTAIDVNNIDSVKLFMQMARGNFVGDSLVPMALQVYPLTRSLPYPIYSDFNPEGYYDPADMLCSSTYTASTQDDPDSLKKLSAIVVHMLLPLELGRRLYTAYEENPAGFADPSAFARNVFKGLYIRSSYGSGRIADFGNTSIRYYYHKEVYNTDSARYETRNYVGDYFAVAPEVILNNNIRYTPDPSLTAMMQAGEDIISAPAGTEMEIRFPAPEIIASYNKYANDLRVLNKLSMTIPADSIANRYGISPSPYLLLVLKRDKDKFFAENSVNDNITSFYAEYNSYTQSYTFGGLRNYIIDLMEKDEITSEDYTFSLCPVQVNLELSASSGYYDQKYVVSSIVPYTSKPVMSKISLDKAKIKLTFSAQNNKNL